MSVLVHISTTVYSVGIKYKTLCTHTQICYFNQAVLTDYMKHDLMLKYVYFGSVFVNTMHKNTEKVRLPGLENNTRKEEDQRLVKRLSSKKIASH